MTFNYIINTFSASFGLLKTCKHISVIFEFEINDALSSPLNFPIPIALFKIVNPDYMIESLIECFSNALSMTSLSYFIFIIVL